MGLLDFSLIKRSIKSAEEQLLKIRQDINDAQRKRREILDAPLCKADLKALIEAWVADSAAKHQQSLAEALKRMARGVRTTYSPKNPDTSLRLFGSTAGFGNEPSAIDLDMALCSVLGREILSSLMIVIDGMDLPGQGLPLVQRQVEADKLDELIGRLIIQENELIDRAADSGINLA